MQVKPESIQVKSQNFIQPVKNAPYKRRLGATKIGVKKKCFEKSKTKEESDMSLLRLSN